MMRIAPQIWLSEDELSFRFVRAPGPGGQNVNKVSSAVELRLDVLRSPSLPDEVKQRVAHLAGKRLGADGVLRIDAHRFRTQHMNRKDAVDRLLRLLQAAAVTPKSRTPTRPGRAAREARLSEKHKTSQIKAARRRGAAED